MTQDHEGLKDGPVLYSLLLLCNPDAQSSVWATPLQPTLGCPGCRFGRPGRRSRKAFMRRKLPLGKPLVLSAPR